MEKIIFRVIVVTSVCCFSKKHVFINNNKQDWGTARKYCRAHYTDMSPLTNEEEEKVFRKAINDGMEGWIGIYWDQHTNKWMWSGGDNVTYHGDLDWPNNTNQHTADNVYWTKDGWEWKNGASKQDFFCLNLTVVQEQKTWEEALGLCRQNGTDLTSLLSVTENLLATNQTSRVGITGSVWIGLRYLGDSWMWVNGDSLYYGNWSRAGGQNPPCPATDRCGALTKGGAWENRDCGEKLSFICG